MYTIQSFYVSWEEFHRDTRKLASSLLPAAQWEGIIAITRGGMIPAAIIARELGIRLIDTVCISSYDHTEQRELTILKHAEGKGENMLLVDDLVDTGKTAAVVRELFPLARFVTVYAKPAGKKLVDDYISEVDQDVWIHFPWDMELNFKKPLVEQ